MRMRCVLGSVLDAISRGLGSMVDGMRRGLGLLVDPLSRGLGLALLGLIRVYQTLVSGGLPPACRFEPTCSRYAYAAIERYGALRGGWLALRRLVRCQPWGGSGYDPVP